MPAERDSDSSESYFQPVWVSFAVAENFAGRLRRDCDRAIDVGARDPMMSHGAK